MTYQDLMAKLEPKAIENAVTAPIEKADLQARYAVENAHSGVIETYEDTSKRIILYTTVLHHQYGLKLPEEYMLGKALDALRVPNLASVHDHVKGTETGLNEYYEKIKRHLLNQQNQAYMNSVFEGINAFDSELIEELCTEYIKRFGRYLPFELRSVHAMMLNWRQIFQGHAQLLDRIRKDVGAL